MERGLMPMSKNKKILMMLAKGGVSQSDIAAALHVSKRDVSAGAKAIREYGLTFDAVSSTDADVVDDLFFPKEERMHLMPLPAERYEMCEWRSAKVAPDYHVTVDYMHYSVDHSLIGKQVDVKLTSSTVTMMHGGAVVAEHPRLRGRKGQYSTIVDHMPENHAALDDPWSPDRFTSWARRIGPEAAAAIDRVLASHAIVEQSFVYCRNILGLSKTYTPALLERACAKMNAASALPSYTGLKNAILAMRAADADARASGRAIPGERPPVLVDRAKSAGRLRGAEAYRRGGERDAD